jgi:mono/diheme cytochrome c family protein
MKARLISLPLLLAAAGAQAADVADGKSLVDQNCHSCHGSEVYTRPDRKVQTLDGLHKQVRRCELALGLRWFDEQVDNASAYLNENYYKLK